MLKFEMCAPQLFLFRLLSRESGVSFTEAQPGSILTALCFEITEKNLVNTSSHQTNLAGTENSNFSTSKVWIRPSMNRWKSNVIFNDLHPMSQNVAWDCLLIPVLCMYCEPKTVLYDLQNNFRFATCTKHGNQQTISCRIIA